MAFLEQRLPLVRRIAGVCVGACFIVGVFVLLPGEAIELNVELSWPRWQLGLARVLAVPLFLVSVGIVFYCAGLFARVGKGTPVPIDPPKQFVASGLYRFSRNPMYVAYVAILISLFLYSGELTLLLYALLIALLLHTWIRQAEEPGLRRRFGEPYVAYTKRVPRWLGAASFDSDTRAVGAEPGE